MPRKKYFATIDFLAASLFTAAMKVQDLTASQLKRAAALKQRIEELTQQLDTLLGAQGTPRRISRKGWTMSAATKKKIAAAQKARWAKLRRAKAAAS